MHEQISVAFDPAKGRIVVANYRLKKGEVICRCGAIPIDDEIRYLLRDCELGRASFANRVCYDRDHDVASDGFVAIGPPTWCSDAADPNAAVDFTEEAGGWYCRLYALRTIDAGDEVTIAYVDLKSGRYPDHPQWQD